MCEEPNLDPLQEKQVLYVTMPSLQPMNVILNVRFLTREYAIGKEEEGVEKQAVHHLS